MVAEPLTKAQRKRLHDIRSKPAQFMRCCHVEDERNQLVLLRDFWPEQRLWVKALLSSKQVLGLKPRQMGFTTITCLFFLWKAITSAHPTKSLQIVHEDQAVFRMMKMLKVAISKLPPELRPHLKTDNIDSTIFDRRGEDGPQFTRMLAGGSGQARSWTYNNIHATEMGHWRRATASNPDGGDGMSADEEAFASALATKHDPDGHIVVESTGNGPSGLFFDLYQRAARGNDEFGVDWSFVFIPWTAVRRYQLELTDAQALKLEGSLDDYERKLHHKGVSLGKLAWRRWRKEVLGLSDLAFRRNYPTQSMEPFLLDDLVWFNAEAMATQMQFAEKLLSVPKLNNLVIHHPYEYGRRYIIGVDTSGGTGHDEAVIQVFRDDLLHVATWATNKARPDEQALAISRVGHMYSVGAASRPFCLIEENKYGRIVIPLVERLGGVVLWKTPDGKDFHTDQNSKRMIFVNARELIDGEYPILQDPLTVAQLANFVELKDGVLHCRMGHDDRALAAVFAMFCWLKLRFDLPEQVDSERERVARILGLFNIEESAHGLR